jgi:hypothetical protein
MHKGKATMTDAHTLRLQLVQAGYLPIPLHGKIPPQREWQKTESVTSAMLDMWDKSWPDAENTGCLTRLMPTLDADILDEAATKAIKEFVRDRYEDAGYVLTRIGKPPKFAIPFRTEEPFKKFVASLIAPNGAEVKIEFLADGEQVVVAGIHPDTGKRYSWSNGGLEQIKHNDLPYIRETEARALVWAIVEMLIRDFGYKRAPGRPKDKATGNARPKDDWTHLFENIRVGREWHDSLAVLAAKLAACGTNSGAVIHQLNALMEATTAPKDERWLARKGEIPRLVDSAFAKYAPRARSSSPPPTEPEPKPEPEPTPPIKDTIAAFRKWLILDDTTPVYTMLGAVAGNLLEGDAVWLGLIAPPSSAKTELLNSLSGLPNVVPAATITPSGLLSGTPKKQHDKGARGGLLRQIGAFGILVLKDFGSIISMHAETRAETLAALREIYDGSWTRHLGAAGGKTLSWQGKVALLFGATEVIDTHYAVMGAMGDRFLLSRLKSVPGQRQFTRALDHAGGGMAEMRKQLATSVTTLFATRRTTPAKISAQEAEAIGKVIALAVRLRGAVERDRRTRELEMIYGAEGTARIGLALERLLAGLDTLGVDRAKGLTIVKRVALDSVPPLRRRAYNCVCTYSARYDPVETADVAIELGLPTNTARRILEDLAAHGLVIRRSQGQGKADIWDAAQWEAEEARQDEADAAAEED